MADPPVRQIDPALLEALLNRREAELLDFRIWEGLPTRDFPECACLHSPSWPSDGGWFASGVLVHPRVVLTAGHCLFSRQQDGGLVPWTVDQVLLGGTTIRDPGAGVLVPVVDQLLCPGFKDAPRIGDLALLVLDGEPPDGLRAIQAPPRATTAELVASGTCTLVGFGRSKPAVAGTFGTKLRVDKVKIYQVRRRQGEDLGEQEQEYGFDADSELVAGLAAPQQDTTPGDSGGPLYVSVGKTFKLAAVTSRAARNGKGGIYVRLDAHEPWMKDVLTQVGGAP